MVILKNVVRADVIEGSGRERAKERKTLNRVTNNQRLQLRSRHARSLIGTVVNARCPTHHGSSLVWNRDQNRGRSHANHDLKPELNRRALSRHVRNHVRKHHVPNRGLNQGQRRHAQNHHVRNRGMSHRDLSRRAQKRRVQSHHVQKRRVQSHHVQKRQDRNLLVPSRHAPKHHESRHAQKMNRRDLNQTSLCSKKEFSRKGAKTQSKPLETWQRFASLRLCVRNNYGSILSRGNLRVTPSKLASTSPISVAPMRR
jgi:hypothetical protein